MNRSPQRADEEQNLAKGTPWEVREFVLYTPNQAGRFEALFTGTDPLTGATVTGTWSSP
jgi:hypothetical protein